MKKFTSLLMSVSLVLAGAAFAQQPEEQSTPGAGKKQGAEKIQQAEPKMHGESVAKPETTTKTHAETKSGANLANPEGKAPTQHAAVKDAGAKKEPVAGKGGRTGAPETSAPATGAETAVSGQAGAGVTTETG